MRGQAQAPLGAVQNVLKDRMYGVSRGVWRFRIHGAISDAARKGLDKLDPVWARVRSEAEDIVRREPELATFIYSSVLHHDTLEAAVVHRIAERLDHPRCRAI